MRAIVRLLVALCCVVAGSAAARSEKRVALIVGNASYAHIAGLPNVPNDAAAMAALFKAAGFEAVDVAHNLGVAELRRALKAFARKVANADVAVLYYAGHGIEVGQTNYLIPIDARLASDFDVEDETVPLDRVLQAMEPVKRLRLVILDACRENPFLKSMKRTVATRSVGRGLGRVEPTAPNTLIAFATKPNAVAEDGTGPNSPFTTALVKHLLTPGLDLRIALGKVRDEVMASTSGRQEPYVTSSLGGEVVSIVPGAAGATVPTPAERTRIELLLEAEHAGILSEKMTALLDEARRRKLVPPPLPPSAGPTQPRKQARYKITAPDGKQYAITAPGDVGEAETLAWFKREVAAAPPKGAEIAVAGSFSARAVMPLTTDQERALKPKDSFRECIECPEMVVVPAGSFTMGSPDSEAGRDVSEGPQHRVTIARPFAVGKFEVTFAEWDACIAAGGCKHKPDHAPGPELLAELRKALPKNIADRADKWPRWFKGMSDPVNWGRGQRPVINASWDDISKEYLPWLSHQTGRTYRLLTEAEWEYAARAGTTTRYAFGDQIDKKEAHYSEDTFGTAGGTVAVGSFPANWFGLHDMHGNVWEWVQDCWDESYAVAPSNGSARMAGNCRMRVIRGGTWVSTPELIRSAVRNMSEHNFRDYATGFRVARTLAE